MFSTVHRFYVANRRIEVLSRWLADLVPADAAVLDIGCGDGCLSSRLTARRPDITVQGIEVKLRSEPSIPVVPYDGRRIPFGNASFDVALLVDVLHHTEDPLALLREAQRVSRQAVIIKDHLCDGWLAWPTLRFMDEVGNRRFGVALPYNYLRREQWQASFAELGLRLNHWNTELKLYPWPVRPLFERSMHFIARLVPEVAQRELTQVSGSIQGG